MRRPLLHRRDASDGLLHREYSGELRVRADTSGEQRVIEGVVIPYGEVVSVQDDPRGPRYRETIAAGAAGQIDPARVQLESLARSPQSHNTHEGALLVGRGLSADDGNGALSMAFRVARTRDGDELLELAREGVLTRMSAVFRPVTDRTRADGVVERTQIELRRVAVVASGAYQGATVTAVRAASEDDMHTCPHCGAEIRPGVAHTCANAPARPATRTTRSRAQAEAEPPAEGEAEEEGDEGTDAPAGRRPNRTRVTVDVERAQAEERSRAAAVASDVRELGRNGSGIRILRPEAVYGPQSEHSFIRDGWLAQRGDAEAAERFRRHQTRLHEVAVELERAAAWQGTELYRAGAPAGREFARAGEVLTSEIPGAVPNEYLPGLLTPRILKGRPMGGFYDRFPISDARPRIFPKVTTSTTVAVQSAEGAALSATDFATTAVTATPLMYGAYTDLSRQALDSADPAASAMILSDLQEAYAQASEAVIKTAVEAGSTDSGIAIVAATPYAGAIANVVNYFTVRFKPARAAFIPSAAFSTLLAQADTTGRPLVPQLGVVNSDGTVNVGDQITAPLLSAQGTLSYQSTANTWVFGVPSDFVIYESSVAQFTYDQVVGPQAVRVGIWAYLVVGTRLGSLKRLAA